MASRDLAREIERAFVLGIQDWGRLVFARSQRYVPVVTGRLKSSGYTRDLPDGMEVGYRANYAEKVEKGLPSTVVPSSYRQGPSGSVSTATSLRGATRPRQYTVVRRPPARYLGRAVDDFLSRLGEIVVNRLRRELK